ncbi:MAG: hypothetical protein IID36_11795 [Planctomycetes bacterium]|nr:hypothetical protein [Planctomycetota bacterium]
MEAETNREILAALPHRPPFRFVDEVVELDPGRRGSGIWRIDGSESFFAGHFPGRPIVPGVLVAEALAQMSGVVALGANFDLLVVPAAVASGSATIGVTNGATEIAINDFDEGYIHIDDDAGQGVMYAITSHPLVAGAGLFTVPLAGDEVVQVAMTTATTVTLLQNPYKGALVTATPATGLIIGCGISVIAVSGFGWIQTYGPASVLLDGTSTLPVLGNHVRASETDPGAVTKLDYDESARDEAIVGYVMEVGVDLENTAIFLTIAAQ